MRAHQPAEPARRTADRPDRSTRDTTDRTTPEHLLTLQRTLGNTAVARMVTQGGGDGVRDVLRSPGRPLADAVRADLEDRLGADFSTVRVHTGAAAQRSADELGARAWTSGENVVIGSGGADEHTLAHELTHVLQQRSGPVAGTDNGAGLRVSDPGDPFERAAETNAHRVMAGLAPTVHDTTAGGRRAATIQRITEYTWRDKTYELSENGLFAIIPGERRIWVRPGTLISSTLERNPKGRRQINRQIYYEYQIKRWILRDCLHTAEEIINGLPGELNSPDELADDADATYSKIRVKDGGLQDFGESDELNLKYARAFAGPKNKNAAPGIGEAFVILAGKKRETAMSPYHAAAVVGVDGRDRVTLEEWSSEGMVSRGMAQMYTVGDAGASFHGAWGTNEEAYFQGMRPITVVIEAAGVSANRTEDTDTFGENTFSDESERELD